MAPADAIAARKFDEIEATVRAAVAQVRALRAEAGEGPRRATEK
jgi:hypothetical protein